MLKKLEENIISVLFIIALIVVIAQGIIKYINPAAATATDEISQYLYCYMAFFGLGYCVKYGSDLTIKLFPKLIDGSLKKPLNVMYKLIYLIVYAILLVGSVQGFIQSGGQFSEAAHLPVQLLYVSAIIGFILGLVRLFQVTFADRKEAEE